MRIRTLTGAVAAVLVLSGPVAGGQAEAVRPAATAAPLGDTRVLTYDAGRAGEFASAVDRGAAVWNDSVDAVELRPAASGEPADIRVVAVDGWPRTVPGAWAAAPCTSAGRPWRTGTPRFGSPPTNWATSWACRTASRARAPN